MDSEHRLFSKQHLIATFWGVVLAAIVFFAGRMWERSDPPQQVVVANPKELQSVPAPTIVNATAELDEESKMELRAAAAAVRRLAAQQGRSLDARESVTTAEIRKLQEKVAELQAATSAATSGLSGAATGSATAAHATPRPPGMISIAPDEPPPPVQLVHPQVTDQTRSEFVLPETAKGFWPRGSPRLLPGLSCPKSRNLKQPSSIALTFAARDSAAIESMSPLYLSIARVDSSTRQTEVFAKYLPLVVGPNSVELATNLTGGKYQLTAGYYLRNKVSGDFPTLYAIQCDFTALP